MNRKTITPVAPFVRAQLLGAALGLLAASLLPAWPPRVPRDAAAPVTSSL